MQAMSTEWKWDLIKQHNRAEITVSSNQKIDTSMKCLLLLGHYQSRTYSQYVGSQAKNRTYIEKYSIITNSIEWYTIDISQ